MAKQIILYNLAPGVTDEQYKEYVTKEKGPLLESLASVEKFELVKVVGPGSEKSPFQYIGILHLKNLEEFYTKDVPSAKFQEFMQKWQSMVSSVQMLTGEEILLKVIRPISAKVFRQHCLKHRFEVDDLRINEPPPGFVD